MPRFSTHRGAGARSVITAFFTFGPSKWVVTRGRNYGGAFIAAVCGLFENWKAYSANDSLAVKVRLA